MMKIWRKYIKNNPILAKYENILFILIISLLLGFTIIIFDAVILDEQRLKGVLIEAHGVLFEFLLVGVVISLFLRWREHDRLELLEPILAIQSTKACNIILQALTLNKGSNKFEYILKNHTDRFVYLFKEPGAIEFTSFAFDIFNKDKIKEIISIYEINTENNDDIAHSNKNAIIPSHEDLELNYLIDQSTLKKQDLMANNDNLFVLERLRLASDIIASSIDLSSNLVILGFDYDRLVELHQLQLYVWEIIRSIEVIPEYNSNNTQKKSEARASVQSINRTIKFTVAQALLIGKEATKGTKVISYKQWLEARDIAINDKLNKIQDAYSKAENIFINDPDN